MAVTTPDNGTGWNLKVAVMVVEPEAGNKRVQLVFSDRGDAMALTVSMPGTDAKLLGAAIARAGVQCEAMPAGAGRAGDR